MLSRQGSQAHRSKIKIIDSTTVTLCLKKFKWAEFCKTKAGIKVHLRLAFLGEQEAIPEKATITVAKKNDRTQMNKLVHEPGVTYVFDRGYIDYSVFDRYYLDGIFFVTRLKSNTHIEPLQELDIPENSPVAADVLVRNAPSRRK
ncbi:transposase [Paenibacillus sp. FSL H7-0326]|uniref:transposase n=1 Tax=Paenibacillus sp. FSL H7-0326 TaxID=1921144 RepID=UPI0015C32D9D|nr:transposase [Paenibacillus sp. FSL H7-0326]